MKKKLRYKEVMESPEEVQRFIFEFRDEFVKFLIRQSYLSTDLYHKYERAPEGLEKEEALAKLKLMRKFKNQLLKDFASDDDWDQNNFFNPTFAIDTPEFYVPRRVIR